MKKLILLLLFTSPAYSAENLYDPSQVPTEGMTYGSPADLKKPAEFFTKLISFAAETGTSALILIKDDKIIVEKYWELEPDQVVRLHSVTKSILSLALGRLVDDGRVSVTDPAKKWFRDWSGEKESITVQQLLSQTSGYPESSKENLKGPNRLKLSLQQKNLTEPGSQFAYSNMGAWLIGDIVHQASKKDPDQYVAESFFAPMSIRKWTWDKDEAQNVDTSSGLWLTARDLSKFGKLLLNQGKWNTEQLISASYLEVAMKPAGTKAKNYGYLWWVNGDNYYARGDFGQILAIYPKDKVILVRLQKTLIHEHLEGSAQAWEKRAKQLGNQLGK